MQIEEQHRYLSPEDIDYLSIRVLNKVEKTFEIVAVLNEAGERYNHAPEMDVAGYNVFESVGDCRAWCKRYYPAITVQRD